MIRAEGHVLDVPVMWQGAIRERLLAGFVLG